VDVSNEIPSSGKERIRHGFDWTVRRHPSVAAGIAGAAITLAGAVAVVAVNTDHGSDNPAATRPPAAGAAPAEPPRGEGAKPPPRSDSESPPKPPAEAPPSPPESPPRSGPGAPPGIPHPPLSRADAGSGAAAGGSAAGGSADGEDAAGGDDASGPPVQRPSPSPPPASSPQPTYPAGPDCVLRVDLLGNVVKICV
jgi:hypothetical protein